jgi:hypothetical protein
MDEFREYIDTGIERGCLVESLRYCGLDDYKDIVEAKIDEAIRHGLVSDDNDWLEVTDKGRKWKAPPVKLNDVMRTATRIARLSIQRKHLVHELRNDLRVNNVMAKKAHVESHIQLAIDMGYFVQHGDDLKMTDRGWHRVMNEPPENYLEIDDGVDLSQRKGPQSGRAKRQLSQKDKKARRKKRRR